MPPRPPTQPPTRTGSLSGAAAAAARRSTGGGGSGGGGRSWLNSWDPTHEPPEDLIAEILRSIEEDGLPQMDAAAAVGVAGSLFSKWMRLGEANARLAQTEGSDVALDWRGQLYLRVRAATADHKRGVVRTLARAAKNDPELGVKYLPLRFGGGSGHARSVIGSDIHDQEAAATGPEHMSDEDLLALLEQTISQAVAAAAAENGGGGLAPGIIPDQSSS